MASKDKEPTCLGWTKTYSSSISFHHLSNSLEFFEKIQVLEVTKGCIYKKERAWQHVSGSQGNVVIAVFNSFEYYHIIQG